MPNFKVYFFQTARGACPVKEFIEAQEQGTLLKITKTIELLERGGPFLRLPYAKKVQQNLYELRIGGRDEIRIFYSKVNADYYLLHAFKKKTQKTPRKEIKIALDRLRDLI